MCEPVRQEGAEPSCVISSDRDENWDEITTEGSLIRPEIHRMKKSPVNMIDAILFEGTGGFRGWPRGPKTFVSFLKNS